MQFLRRRLTLQDFIPPIVGRLRSALWRRYQRTSEPAASAPDFFMNPILGSFSQFGEDFILDALLNGQAKGVYIDVGANDPVHLSNTCRFYRRGWRGLNVEPLKSMWQRLNAERPEDVNLNVGVGQKNGNSTFYEMSIDTYSTFNRQNSAEFCPGKEISAKIEMPVMALSKIWEEHFGEKIVDFLSVDVEGDNLGVLKGNDWMRHRPRFVLVEMDRNERPGIIAFLNDNNYEFLYANHVNGIFKDRLG